MELLTIPAGLVVAVAVLEEQVPMPLDLLSVLAVRG
jgi:hypothetical protein